MYHGRTNICQSLFNCHDYTFNSFNLLTFVTLTSAQSQTNLELIKDDQKHEIKLEKNF